VRPSAQWRHGPHSGGDGVHHGQAAKTTQHDAGRCNPRGGGDGEAYARWCRSPWQRMVVACCICVALALWSWQWLDVGHGSPSWRVTAGGDGLLCVRPP
jgi:hypothetical protein